MKNFGCIIFLCVLAIIVICIAGFDISFHATYDGQTYKYDYNFHPFDKFLKLYFQ